MKMPPSGQDALVVAVFFHMMQGQYELALSCLASLLGKQGPEGAFPGDPGHRIAAEALALLFAGKPTSSASCKATTLMRESVEGYEDRLKTMEDALHQACQYGYRDFLESLAAYFEMGSLDYELSHDAERAMRACLDTY